jgi:hypothetical protein
MNTSVQLQAQIGREQYQDRHRFAEKVRTAQMMKYGEDGKPEKTTSKGGWLVWLITWLF